MTRRLVAGVICGLLIAAPVAAQRGAASGRDAGASDWPSEDPPPPLLERDVIFPEYEVRTLDNGLQVVFVGHHEQPAVNVRLLVRAGASSDPGGTPGIAAMAAQLLDQGTTTRSAQDIARQIDYVGGVLGVGAASDLSFVNTVVMSDSFDLALDLLSDVTRHPAFAPAELERQRQQVLSGMQVSYDDPGYLASVVFNRLVYGFHPYGMPHNGTPESVRAIGREDLVTFHAAHYMPNNAVLAIVGDVTAEQAFAGAERALGDWAKGDLPRAPADETPSPTRRLIVVDKPGAVQTAVRAGHLALPRAHPDFLAFDVAIKILGGEGGNRLGGVLRTERSLTYAASADTAARRSAGDFMATTDTRSVATAEALRLTVDEIARLQREPVTERELRGAQAYLAGNFPITLETPNAIAVQVLEAILFGLDLDELETYRERINGVTVGDIRRVAQAYLKPGNLSIVLVGDASTFVDDLAGVGFDRFEVISQSELDLSSADLKRPSGVAP